MIVLLGPCPCQSCRMPLYWIRRHTGDRLWVDAHGLLHRCKDVG